MAWAVQIAAVALGVALGFLAARLLLAGLLALAFGAASAARRAPGA